MLEKQLALGAVVQQGQRRDLGRAEDVGGIGAVDHRPQVFRRNVVAVQAKDGEGQLGIALAAPALQRGVVHLGNLLGHDQAAIRGEAAEQDAGEWQRLHAVAVAIMLVRIRAR